MPDHVKLTGKPMQQRLDDRLQNSGSGAKPDQTVKHGEGARRTFHNLHFSSSQGGTKQTKESK
jgi:hypothetical protein